MKAKWLGRRIAHPGPYLTLCTSEAEYFSALKSVGAQAIDKWIKNDHSTATAHYLTHKDGNQAVIVCINVTSTHGPIEIAGLLIHESVHVFQQYCEWIGESSPGIEQEAYGIQCISQELLAEYALRMQR